MRTGSRLSAWPVALSGLLLAHFVLSAGVWHYWLAVTLRRPHLHRDLAALPAAAPAFLLLALSAGALALAARGHRLARPAALLTLAAAVAAFAADVSLGRWQVHAHFAPREYWDAGGREHVYFTWWWFNDRWLR